MQDPKLSSCVTNYDYNINYRENNQNVLVHTICVQHYSKHLFIFSLSTSSKSKKFQRCYHMSGFIFLVITLQ